MSYTHIFINHTHQMVPLPVAKDALKATEARAFGFLLVDANQVKFDKHGKPCHRSGGWSYGHIQNGYICAGAGGVNSMPILKMEGE